MSTEQLQEDVIKHLMTGKYDKEISLSVLSKLESERKLTPLIKKYHPKYYVSASKYTPETVASITLAIDLGYC